MAATAFLARHLPPDPDAGDGDLLSRYATTGDDAAFAELVRRTGPVVLRACRHALGDGPAADDAFQATFLLLARKAGRLGDVRSLAGWLHAAAVRVAQTARRAEERRRRREQRWERPAASADDLTWREVRERLDAELAALPERYRVPLVLCYLQELSYDEAARRAECTTGALRGRLEGGKALLRGRLAKYGLGAAPLLVVGPPPAVSAALGDAARAVAHAGLTGGPVPAAVARLAVSPVRVWKPALLGSAAALLLATGVALVAASGPPQPEKPAPAKAEAAPVDALGDPLPPGAVARLGTRRFQAPTYPLRPLPLPDGKRHLAYYRDTATGKPEFRWLDAATGKVLDTWPTPDGTQPAGLSPDGRFAVLVPVKVWHTGFRTEPEKPDRTLTAHVYDLGKKEKVATLTGEFDASEGDMAAVHDAVFSADGRWLATVNSGHSRSGRVRVWDLTAKKPLWASAWGGGQQGLRPLGFAADGSSLVMRGANDNWIQVLDTTNRQVVGQFATMPRDQTQEVALSPDGAAVVMGTFGSDVRRWDVTTGKELPALGGHTGDAAEVAFAADGKTLVTGGADPFLLVRDWPSGEVRQKVAIGRPHIQELFVPGTGGVAVVMFWWEHTLARFDLASGKELAGPPATHRAEVYAVAAAADGTVVSLGKDKVLRSWDPATGKQTAAALLDPIPVWGPFAPSPDGKKIAVGDYGQKEVVFYDRFTGKVLGRFEAAGVDRMVWSPDGRYLAAGGRDAKTIRVWEHSTGKKVADAPAAAGGWWTGGVGFAFSPDGKLFAATEEGKVNLWETDGWKPVGGITGYAGSLSFSPDSRMLAGDSLHDVTVWEVATRKPRAVIRDGRSMGRLTRFAPDGRHLAWVGADQTVVLWDLWAGRRAAAFRGHDAPVQGMTFTADGRRLVTASDDCTLLVWDTALSPKADAAEPGDAVDDLGDADAAKGFAAVKALAAGGKPAVEAIRRAVKPVAAADAEVVRTLLAALDDDRFDARDRATKDLIALGDAAVEQVRRFRAGTKSDEAGRRADEVLAAARAATPDRVRAARAVEALERNGTAEARGYLKELAAGAPGAGLTRDATAALGRLDRASGGR